MTTTQHAIDRIDDIILLELQKDARLSNKELAARVGLAPSSCLVRVQRLFASGVLTGSHARVDPAAMGIGLAAMISVQLGRHGRGTIERVAAELLALPEVVQLYHVAGSQDLLVHVVARGAEHLRVLVTDHFSAREEVAHIETALIFEHHRADVVPRLDADDPAPTAPRARP